MPRTRGSTTKKDGCMDHKQQRFPRRTHIARERSSLPGSAKEKRQSSLTQLAFVSTPRTSFDETKAYSDYEDADLEEPQPRKKQRVSFAGDEKAKTGSSKKDTGRKSEKGQDTLTQRYDWVPSSAQGPDNIEDDSDDPGFNIYDDEGRERFTAMIGEKQKQRKRRLPWLVGNEATRGALSVAGVIPTRRYNLRSPEKGAEAVDDSGYISNSTTANDTPARRYDLRSPPMARKPTSSANLLAHSIAARDFLTPRKRARLQEIPSSNTPPSAKVFSQHSQRSENVSMLYQSPSKSRAVTRSPLKEKSANVQPVRWNPKSPESQNPTMKALEKVRQQKMAALHNTTLDNRPPSISVADKTLEPDIGIAAKQAMPAPQPPPQTLKRARTVQDSQADEFDILTEALPQAPTRELKWTNTVQDSQYEDLDLSSQIYRTISSDSLEAILETDSHNEDDEYEHDEDYDNEQYTYDPVSAALDRDAARYGMTHTQAPATLAQNSIADYDDSDGDDLNVDTIPDSDDDEGPIALSPLRQPKKALQELSSSDFADPPPIVAETQGPPAIIPESDSPIELASSSQPSSPPPFHLRPSQVSTIVPTQASPYQQQLGGEHYSPPTSPQQSLHEMATPEARPGPQNTQPARRLFDKSQGMTQAQSTFSSSPLPLPPWSSPERARWAAVQTQTQKRGERDCLEPLTDFSLPPPPPLPSSSVGNTGG